MRNFFDVSPEKAYEFLKYFFETSENVLNLRLYDQKGEVKERFEKKTRREKFRFSMIGLKQGDFILFDEKGISVEILNDNEILYENKKYSLSGFCEKKMGYGSYQGPKFFSYNGKTLADLRDEAERKNKNL